VRGSGLLGPFHTGDADFAGSGGLIAGPNKDELCIVRCTRKDASGNLVRDSAINIWGIDITGHHDTQREGREGQGRPGFWGALESNKDGEF